jgi:hypothetical protein
MMQQKVLQIVLLSGALGLAISGKAQQPTEPFKGSNIVWAQTTMPADSVLKGLARYLEQRGFVLDTLDRVRGVLTTKVVLPAASRAGEMKIRATQVGTEWKLTGIYVIPAYGSGVAYPASFIGAEMMPAKSAFRMVEEVARVIPRSTLRYDKAKVKFGVLTKMEDALQSVW